LTCVYHAYLLFSLPVVNWTTRCKKFYWFDKVWNSSVDSLGLAIHV
jgi:hypothetical protein